MSENEATAHEKYYPINEDMARKAKSMWSFNDYVENSATNDYRARVDEAYALCDDVPDHSKEKALYYANMFAKKYAENINKRFRIDLICPSMMIVGGGNFPVKKKEKQFEALRNAMKERDYIFEYVDKIKRLIHYVPQDIMHGTDTEETFDNPYFTVAQNEPEDRIQLFFEGKPSDDVRELLKKRGWRWSGKNKCWQRQLTDNARTSVRYIIAILNKDKEEKQCLKYQQT